MSSNLTRFAPLACVSVDVLRLIGLKIDTRELVRLKMCGHRQLWAKIEASCVSVRLRLAPHIAFPFSAFDFALAVHISVSLPKHFEPGPLRLNRRLPLPSKPMSSVQSLRFDFSQSLRALALVEGAPTLSTSFPNLTRLKLLRSTVCLEEEHLQALPRTLKCFVFKPFISALEPLYFSSLSHLPPQLESLTMKRVYIRADDENGEVSGLAWPKTLTKLQLGVLESPSILWSLPEHIEELNIMCGEKWRRHLRTSEIPATIRKFTLRLTRSFPPAYKTYPRFKIISDGVFPPFLTVYNVNEGVDIDQMSQLEGMPTKIEILPLKIVMLRMHSQQIQKLFPNLTSIRRESVYLHDMEFLPTTLKEVAIQTMTMPSNNSPWDDFPKNVTAYNGPLKRSQQLLSLPPGLKRLSVWNEDRSIMLEPALFEAMPTHFKHLVHLNFSLDHVEPKECLAHLPLSLKFLGIESNRLRLMTQDEFLLKQLPVLRHLETLRIGYSYWECAWRQWIRYLTEDGTMPALTTLDVTQRFVYRAQDSPTIATDDNNSYLQQLPPTLTSAMLPIDPYGIGEVELAKLPKTLNTLVFRSIICDKDERSRLGLFGDEQLQYLPKSTTVLNLSDCTTLTDNAFKFLLPGIPNLILPQNLATHAQGLEYYSSECWER